MCRRTKLTLRNALQEASTICTLPSFMTCLMFSISSVLYLHPKQQDQPRTSLQASNRHLLMRHSNTPKVLELCEIRCTAESDITTCHVSKFTPGAAQLTCKRTLFKTVLCNITNNTADAFLCFTSISVTIQVSDHGQMTRLSNPDRKSTCPSLPHGTVTVCQG